MFFLLNTANNEVTGYYNQRDYVRALRNNEDYAQICNTRAADIMHDQIWAIAPNYEVDMWSTAEDIYPHYIRRGNLYNN